jgi:DHA1 family bicyclomycin/chloramphenicol resistance-like MFS transporter
LPSLPHELNTSVSAAQLTLSALIICFGMAQLACGPLADRFGRRPVLLVGLSLYTATSAFAAVSTSIEWLVTWRALQGAAMAAAVTCGRSIIRDLYHPEQGARVMARSLGGLGLIAFSCPLLGGAIVNWLDWHAALMTIALYGATATVFIATRFVETVPQRNPRATQIEPLLRNWKQILSDPTFRAFTLLLSLTYGGVFVLLAASSFVYIEVLGVSRLACGAILASNSIFYVLGTLLCRRLLSSHGLRRTIAIGGFLSLGGGVLTAVLSLAGFHNLTVWSVIVPAWFYMLGHGIHQPCGQAGAIGPFPDKAGTAASLSGFVMMVGAFGIGLMLGRGLNGSVYPLTLGLGVFGCSVALVAWTLVQRHGEPVALPAPQPV